LERRITMANLVNGVGNEYDFTMDAGAEAKTTTSQYKVGVVSAAHTFNIVSSTATARTAIGINQSYMTSGSVMCKVRTHGLSKAYCGDSVTAGQWIRAYEGVSTTSRYGTIQGLPAAGASISVATTSVTSYSNVLGWALDNGQTGQAISVYLNPYQIDESLLS
jgi:hypothetical protein